MFCLTTNRLYIYYINRILFFPPIILVWVLCELQKPAEHFPIRFCKCFVKLEHEGKVKYLKYILTLEWIQMEAEGKQVTKIR